MTKPLPILLLTVAGAAAIALLLVLYKGSPKRRELPLPCETPTTASFSVQTGNCKLSVISGHGEMLCPTPRVSVTSHRNENMASKASDGADLLIVFGKRPAPSNIGVVTWWIPDGFPKTGKNTPKVLSTGQLRTLTIGSHTLVAIPGQRFGLTAPDCDISLQQPASLPTGNFTLLTYQAPRLYAPRDSDILVAGIHSGDPLLETKRIPALWLHGTPSLHIGGQRGGTPMFVGVSEHFTMAGAAVAQGHTQIDFSSGRPQASFIPNE